MQSALLLSITHHDMRKLLLIISTLTLCFISHTSAQKVFKIPGSEREIDVSGLNSLRVSLPFLSIAPDTRSGGMGDVGGASTPDVNSQHWNVAKYPFLKDKKFGASFTYTPWLKNLDNSIGLSYLAGYYRFDEMQAISASLRYFTMGEVIFTNLHGDQVKKYTPHEFAIDVGYSRRFSDKISSGLAFRYTRSNLTGGYSNDYSNTTAGQTFAADMAMYFQTPINIGAAGSEYALGVSITNLGAKMSYSDDRQKEFIPTNLRIANRLSMNIDEYNSFSFNIDLNKLLVPTPGIYVNDTLIAGHDHDVGVMTGVFQSFYDAPSGFKEEMQEIMIGLGIEYWYAQQFAVRAGYHHQHANKGPNKYFTVGAGLRYNILTLDFSYLIPTIGNNSPLANTVRITIGVDVESSKSKKAKKGLK